MDKKKGSLIKRLWYGMLISFAMYSKIPMPMIDWSDENMEYSMCFFPMVGAVIGGLMYGWYVLTGILPFGTTFNTAIYLVIPMIISGGIHLDGLLDTADALSSWQPMERRLEILKDSNSGAFAIIIGFLYFIVYFGVMSEVGPASIGVICISFTISRALSGYGVVTLPKARKTGLAVAFANPAQSRVVQITMIVILVVCAGLLFWVNAIPGVAVMLGAGIAWFFHVTYSKKYFGGITGDLCGAFTQISELLMAMFAIIAAALI